MLQSVHIDDVLCVATSCGIEDRANTTRKEYPFDYVKMRRNLRTTQLHSIACMCAFVLLIFPVECTDKSSATPPRAQSNVRTAPLKQETISVAIDEEDVTIRITNTTNRELRVFTRDLPWMGWGDFLSAKGSDGKELQHRVPVDNVPGDAITAIPRGDSTAGRMILDNVFRGLPSAKQPITFEWHVVLKDVDGHIAAETRGSVVQRAEGPDV